MLFGTYTWVVTPHMVRVLGGVTGIGGATIYREAPAETEFRKMGIHLGGGGKIGG